MDEKQRALWEQEYQKGEVASSERDEISHSVEYLKNFAETKDISLEKGRMLDIGCGNGRNLIWFAEKGMEAYGIDIAENALQMARKKVASRDLRDKASLIQQSMTDEYPFEDNFFDLIICTTAMENLFTDKEVEKFKRQFERVLKPGGHLLLYYVTPQDGYYQKHVEEKPENKVLEIEEIKIKQRFYTQEEVRKIFQKGFKMIDSEDFKFKDKQSGQTYDRHLKANIWKKK